MVRVRSSKMWGRITIPLIICCLLAADTALALDGSGTEQDPWRIKSLADFDEFAADANYWDDYTRLETDVNLAGRVYDRAVIAPDVNNSNWEFDGIAFTGVFDGNDYKIINLTIDDAGAGNDNLGLFGYIHKWDGEVTNLGLEGGSVSGADWAVAGLVGHNEGDISNCYSTVDVSSTSWIVGGLVGENYAGSVSNCYSTGDVNGYDRVGGLVGENFAGSVSNCYSTGSVSSDGGVGGLVGWNWSHATVSNCYSTGSVSGDWYVGGLVGFNGYCIPLPPPDEPIEEPGYIYNSYSTGAVQGNSSVGGLVGFYGCGDIEMSFWDVETSGMPYSNGGEGKTTAEMQTKSTFTSAGWDFVNIWDLTCEGMNYPRFIWQMTSPDFVCPHGVDFRDYSFFANHWLDGNCGGANDCDGADLDFSDKVDGADLKIFFDHWLKGM